MSKNRHIWDGWHSIAPVGCDVYTFLHNASCFLPLTKILTNSQERHEQRRISELAKSIGIGIGIGFLSCIGIGIGIVKTIFEVLVLVLVLLRGFPKYWYWYC